MLAPRAKSWPAANVRVGVETPWGSKHGEPELWRLYSARFAVSEDSVGLGVGGPRCHEVTSGTGTSGSATS